MPIELIPTLLIQILVVGYSPGPANLYAFSMAVRHGRKQALRMWFGQLTGFTVAVLTLAVATHFAGMVMGHYVAWLKYAGATYLLYLAIVVYKRSKHKQSPTTVETGKLGNNECSFTSGMIVQLTNAKILLFELTVFSTFVLPYSNRLADLLTTSAWLLLAGPGANLLWLYAGSAFSGYYHKHRKAIDLISAILLFACAIYIAL